MKIFHQIKCMLFYSYLIDKISQTNVSIVINGSNILETDF